MIYGGRPKDLGTHEVDFDEMMFYQYLPIKLIGQVEPTIEDRLLPLSPIIGACCCDFVADFGLNRYLESYVYLTVKRMYQSGGCSFNRKGYHSDGFMTEDINYLWSDESPTIFNSGHFFLTLDDTVSMKEMEDQANKEEEYSYPKKSLLRLDQSIIHKVAEDDYVGMRTFIKVSFSKDKYDLRGNAKNYLLDYDWDMRDRKESRNIPQNL